MKESIDTNSNVMNRFSFDFASRTKDVFTRVVSAISWLKLVDRVITLAVDRFEFWLAPK